MKHRTRSGLSMANRRVGATDVVGAPPGAPPCRVSRQVRLTRPRTLAHVATLAVLVAGLMSAPVLGCAAAQPPSLGSGAPASFSASTDGTGSSWGGNGTSSWQGSPAGGFPSQSGVQAGPSILDEVRSVSLPAQPTIHYADYNVSSGSEAGSPATDSSLQTGNNPYWEAYDPINGNVYVADHNGSSVSIIDGATESANSVTVGLNPLLLTVDLQTNAIYVPNSGASSVSVIQGGSGSVTTLPLKGCTYPHSVTFDPVNGYLYVPCYGSAKIAIINGASNHSAGSFKGTLTTGNDPANAALDETNGLLYVTNLGSNTVTVVNTVTNSIKKATIHVKTSPNFAVYNPSNGEVYVGDGGTNFVSIISVASNICIHNETVGTDPTGLVYDPGNSEVYVLNSVSNNVTIIQGSSNVVRALSVGTHPRVGTFDSANGFVYVANSQSASVSAINTSSNQVVTVYAGSHPWSAQFDSGNGAVYVANGASNNVTVIPTAALIPQQSAPPVGSTPSLAAVDTWNGLVYIPNRGSSTISILNSTTGQRVKTLTLTTGWEPWSATFDSVNGCVYVPENGAHVVTIVNGTRFLGNITTGKNPRFATVDPANDRVFVLNHGSSTVGVVSGATNANISWFKTGKTPQEAVYDPADGYLYIAAYGANVVDIVNPTTYVLVAHPTSDVHPMSPVYDPVDEDVYVGTEQGNYIDYLSGTTLSSLQTGSVYGSDSGVFDPANGFVYFAQSGGGVAVVNGTSLAREISTDEDGAWATVDPGNGLVVVSNSNASNATIIDGLLDLSSAATGAGPAYSCFVPVSGAIYIDYDGGSSGVTVLEMQGPIPVVSKLDFVANSTNTSISLQVSPHSANVQLSWGNASTEAIFHQNVAVSHSGGASAFLNYLEPSEQYDSVISIHATGDVPSEIVSFWKTGSDHSLWINGTVYNAAGTTRTPSGMGVEVTCARPVGTNKFLYRSVETNSLGQYSVFLGQGGNGDPGNMTNCNVLDNGLYSGYNVSVLDTDWPRYFNETIFTWNSQLVNFYLPHRFVSPYFPVVLDFSNAPAGYSMFEFTQGTETSLKTEFSYSWTLGGQAGPTGGLFSGSSSNSTEFTEGSGGGVLSQNGTLDYVAQTYESGTVAFSALSRSWAQTALGLYLGKPHLYQNGTFAQKNRSFTPPVDWLTPSNVTPDNLYYLTAGNLKLMDNVLLNQSGKGYYGYVTTSTTNSSSSGYGVTFSLTVGLPGVGSAGLSFGASWSQTSSTKNSQTLEWTILRPVGDPAICADVLGQGGHGKYADVLGIYTWTPTQQDIQQGHC